MPCAISLAFVAVFPLPPMGLAVCKSGICIGFSNWFSLILIIVLMCWCADLTPSFILFWYELNSILSICSKIGLRSTSWHDSDKHAWGSSLGVWDSASSLLVWGGRLKRRVREDFRILQELLEHAGRSTFKKKDSENADEVHTNCGNLSPVYVLPAILGG